MTIKTQNSFDNKDFSVFVDEITKGLKAAIEKYWEQDIDLTLQALNDFRDFREERLSFNIDYFTSQIRVDRHKPFIIRLDKDFIHSFFDTVLQPKTNNFKLTELTNLEVKILNNFCEFLYKRLKELPIFPQKIKLSEESEKYINLLFLLEIKNAKNFPVSQIMLSFAKDRMPLEILKKAQSFADEDFFTSSSNVKIRAGKTKITLDELKNLTIDDIVLLEDSKSTNLTLISGDLEEKFNIKLNPDLVLNIDQETDDLENNYDEVIMDKNLWDDIQVEVNAEFEKVKMTIGELKQISRGQIVDLSSIFENEISLFVEDKKVAKGELIIINDRYAVRINEVLSNKKVTPQAQAQPQAKPQQAPKTATPPPPQPQRKPQPQPQAQARPQPKPQPQVPPKAKPAQDEEFDYSDFEK